MSEVRLRPAHIFPIVMISDVNVRENDGETAGMWAAGMGHGDDVKYLHQAGADIKLGDIHGKTAVMLAAFKGHGDVVKCLRNPD